MKPKRVALIATDFPAYEKFCPNFVGMMMGLETLGIEAQLFSCRPKLDVQSVISYGPDLVIYGLLDMIKNPTWRSQIREGLPDAKIVMWYGDLRDANTGQIRANVSEIDMMFVSNDAQNHFYERLWKVPACHFLPLGSPVYDAPIKQKYAEMDFVFIGGQITGAGFLERARTIWRYRDNGLRVIDGPSSRPDLRAKVFKEMPSIYRSAKIVLDYSHFTDIKGYTSNRFWIITGSGGFALTKRWPGCEDFYPPGTRVYFDTFDQSLKLRDYYLSHPEEREKIRAAGHKHAQNHTYDKRFLEMFSKLYAEKKD